MDTRDLLASASSGCYSVREVWQLASSLGEDEAPRGLLPGLKAFVEQDERARAQFVGNRPKRRRLLSRADNLPFTLHEDLVCSSPEHALTVPTSDVVVWYGRCDLTVRDAIVAEAGAVLTLVRFLALLVLSSGRQHPLALLMCWFLANPTALEPTAGPETTERLTRVTRPPGQFVVAGPRVARAPGVVASLAALCSEGHGGIRAPRGSALLA